MRRIALGVASVAAVALAASRIFFTTVRTARRSVIEWQQKRKLRRMLGRIGSIRHLEKGIGADRPTTERLLLAVRQKVWKRRMDIARALAVSPAMGARRVL